LKIKRNGTKPYDQYDYVTVTDFEGKIIGKLKVMTANADPKKAVKVNILKVYLGENPDPKTNNVKSVETLMRETLDFLNNRAYNQCFVSFTDGEKGELSISNTELESFIETRMSGSVITSVADLFNEQGEIKLYSKMKSENAIIGTYLQENPEYANWKENGKTIIIIANRNKEQDTDGRTLGYALNNNNIFLFCNGSLDYANHTHEIGHLLGLEHSFDPPYNILKGATNNFMDYAPNINMFWKWQWDELRKKYQQTQ
jgi:hypothetical protein